MAIESRVKITDLKSGVSYSRLASEIDQHRFGLFIRSHLNDVPIGTRVYYAEHEFWVTDRQTSAPHLKVSVK